MIRIRCNPTSSSPLRRALLLGAATTLAALSSLAAGCGGGDGDSSSSGDTPKRPRAADVATVTEPPTVVPISGQRGGTLTFAESGDMTTFNPITSSSATEGELAALVFDTLVSYDNGAWEQTPSLAHAWEVTEDNLDWTFHLRKGIKWSDGEDFTADDVLFSFATSFHPKVPNSNKDGFRVGNAPFPDVVKLDDHTVRFECQAVDAMFLVHAASVKILPEHIWADSLDAANPTFPTVMGTAEHEIATVVGTGPFRLVSYAASERIVYERNPLYWKQDQDGTNLPYLDKLIVLLVSDLSTRSTQFLNGAHDLINDIPVPDYDRMKAKEKEGAFTIHRPGLTPNTYWVSFNQHPGGDEESVPFVKPHLLKWFQDVRFRRAMSHAIDREALVKQFMGGKGAAIYSQTNRGNKTWHHDVPKTEYNPQKAGALLDQMGLRDRDGDGVREDDQGNKCVVELTTNVNNPLRVQIITQIKVDWTAVGVDTITRPMDFNELVNQLEDGHKWEAMLLGWGSGVPPDPLNGKNIHLSSGRLHVWYPMQAQPANAWEVRNDALIAEMDATTAEPERIRLWGEFLMHQAQGLPMLYLVSPNAYAATKPRVQNVRPSVLRPMTTYSIEELWVDDGL